VATQAEAQQQQLFARAMPGKRLPIDPALVLAAELRRLKALAGDDEGVDSGSAGDEGSPAELWSASSQRSVLLLLLLRQALALLPAPEVLRYRVLELRLDARRLQIEGQARSHGDAEAIATALRNGGIFDPEPPRSEQLPSKPGDAVPPGVSFSLVAAVNVAGQDQRKPDAVERREAK
jgi:hypothetical protein